MPPQLRRRRSPRAVLRRSTSIAPRIRFRPRATLGILSIPLLHARSRSTTIVCSCMLTRIRTMVTIMVGRSTPSHRHQDEAKSRASLLCGRQLTRTLQ